MVTSTVSMRYTVMANEDGESASTITEVLLSKIERNGCSR